mmetsp:Transcript_37958/g.82544  ORF Transcript_37958/g.82544 Transcript_37958/m.82544 type:complete len:201 (+) Transcript_37958:61-663(+)
MRPCMTSRLCSKHFLATPKCKLRSRLSAISCSTSAKRLRHRLLSPLPPLSLCKRKRRHQHQRSSLQWLQLPSPRLCKSRRQHLHQRLSLQWSWKQQYQRSQRWTRLSSSCMRRRRRRLMWRQRISKRNFLELCSSGHSCGECSGARLLLWRTSEHWHTFSRTKRTSKRTWLRWRRSSSPSPPSRANQACSLEHPHQHRQK